jgi:acetyl-CoA C-acetyltransferase
LPYCWAAVICGFNNRFMVGATGARMLFDASKQVRGIAGDVQVDNAKTFATLNIGGSLSTVASFVVGVRD